MVSLAGAKQFLGFGGADDDVLLERLLSACTEYLARIGVTVDPMPAPVGEAIYLMVSIMHRRTDRDFGERQTETDGIGSHSNFDPQLIDAANWKLIRIMTDPYREACL